MRWPRSRGERGPNDSVESFEDGGIFLPGEDGNVSQAWADFVAQNPEAAAIVNDMAASRATTPHDRRAFLSAVLFGASLNKLSELSKKIPALDEEPERRLIDG